MFFGAYTISPTPVTWKLQVPHWNQTEPQIGSPLRHDYVDRLADKRNRAIEKLLYYNPDTQAIVCCDSAYCDMPDEILRLMRHYAEKGGGMVLGGGVWGIWKQRAKDLFKHRVEWCDRWGVNELSGANYEDYCEHHGFLPVKGVSGIHVFPRRLWDQGLRYGVLEDRNSGTETTYLARHSGVPCYIDLDTFFYRERVFSAWKCIQCSIGLRSRLGFRNRRVTPCTDPGNHDVSVPKSEMKPGSRS